MDGMQSRLQQYQQELLELRMSGQLSGVGIDDAMLANAAARSPFSPKEWRQVEDGQKNDVRQSVSAFWKQHAAHAQKQWLADKTHAPMHGDPPSVDETVSSLRNVRGRYTPRFGSQFAQSMDPHQLRTAVTGILTDLQNWDTLPEKTVLGKLRICFFDPARIGVAICGGIIILVVVALVVVLTIK